MFHLKNFYELLVCFDVACRGCDVLVLCLVCGFSWGCATSGVKISYDAVDRFLYVYPSFLTINGFGVCFFAARGIYVLSNCTETWLSAAATFFLPPVNPDPNLRLSLSNAKGTRAHLPTALPAFPSTPPKRKETEKITHRQMRARTHPCQPTNSLPHMMC